MGNSNLQKAILLNGIVNSMQDFSTELKAELNEILSYWISNTIDPIHGGFIGRIDENNLPHPEAPKGAVLNSRILWAFSSAYLLTKNEQQLATATLAFTCLKDYFIDKKYGGVYWTVSNTGHPMDTKKQIYALAFAMYGCCAFYTATKIDAAKKIAIDLFYTIEKYSFDKKHTGYLEAFTQDWSPLDDLRLSVKDANEKKTMNTHLHVLEAYTALYGIWPDAKLKAQIVCLIKNFTQHIIDATTGHLQLFFEVSWKVKSTIISYGHDIEASWLLLEAAAIIQDKKLIEALQSLGVKISIAAAEGLDVNGGLWYELDTSTNHLIKEKHSWVQAEAMVGFFNSWQTTNDTSFLKKSIRVWNYIKAEIKDTQHGEWFWGRNEDGTVMQEQDKVGIWKCPYHNSRACIEIIKRIANGQLQ